MVQELQKLIKYTCAHVFKSSIPVSAFVNVNNNRALPSNWGDDINYFLLKELTKKEIIIRNWSLPCRLGLCDDYICIGSTLSMLATSRSIVWGTGVISDKEKLPARPKRVLAVRGPLTRKWLLSQNVPCPEVYGDPALLAPYVYTPKVEKEFDFGLIPHYSELESPVVQRFLSKNPNVHLINISKYEAWTDFIDEINKCNYIISSSLHGIIISDAYRVPCAWLKPSASIIGETFKYYDYFESTSYADRKTCSLSWNSISKQLDAWISPKIDLSPLIDSAPFSIFI